MEKKGFTTGLGEVKKKDYNKVKEEIMLALGNVGKMSFSNHSRGLIELKVWQATVIEAVFSKYGIKNIWDK